MRDGRWNGFGAGCAVVVVLAAAAGCEQRGQATESEARPAASVETEPLASPAPREPATDRLAAARSQPPAATPRPRAPRPAPALPPGVSFDPPTLDMGFVKPNQDARGEVAIRNNGTAPVTIWSVRPTCKCTALNNLDGTVIPPGGAATLRAQLDGRSVTGPRSAAIRVLFEGASEPALIDIVAEVTLPIRISPSILNLVRSDPARGHVVVESVDGRPFNVLAADGRPPTFIEFDPDIDAPRNSYALEWDLTSELASGTLPSWWIVETDHPECPLVDAWVRHQSTIQLPPRDKKWMIVDRRVMLGRVEPDTPTQFTITVKDLAGDSIYAVRSLSDEFTVKLIDQEFKDRDATVTIELTPRQGHRGLLFGPLEVLASVHTQQIHVIAKVSDGGA